MSEARRPASENRINEDRIYALAEGGGAYFIARQSGLYRLSCAQVAEDAEDAAHAMSNLYNLYEGWQANQEIATLDVALSPHFSQDGEIFAGIKGGVARSEDGGATWQALALRQPAPLITCLALSPAFSSDRRLLAGSYQDGVFLSDDGGHTWKSCNFGLFDRNIYSLALSPAYPADGLALAGASSGLYRSVNGGRLWQDICLPWEEAATLSLAFSPDDADDRSIFAGTESQGLLRSQDGGATWRVYYECGGAVNAILCLPGAGLAIQVEDSVLVYDSEDRSWRQVAAAGVHVASSINSSADGSALLLGMADGSLQRLVL